MRGKFLRILITAGPTREPIDPVRFISNYSTGLMGAALASEALNRGYNVTVILGPCTTPMPKGARVIPVETSLQMADKLARLAKSADAVIMAAAVADYSIVSLKKSKIRRNKTLSLKLKATKDIIAALSRQKGQVVVGFALESRDVVSRAARKLKEKKLDLLLAQQIQSRQSPFGKVRVRAWLIEKGKKVKSLGRLGKAAIARVLLDKIEALCYLQTSRKKALSPAGILKCGEGQALRG